MGKAGEQELIAAKHELMETNEKLWRNQQKINEGLLAQNRNLSKMIDSVQVMALCAGAIGLIACAMAVLF